MKIKIKILSWILQFEISIKKRWIDYRLEAKKLGWYLDLPAPGQPKLRFAKYTGSKLTENGLGEYMTRDFSYVSTWKELCKEQNINV